MKNIILIIILVTSVVGHTAHAQITGLTAPEAGTAFTYSYTDNFIVVPEWTIAAGSATVNSTWAVGNTYYASVTWTATGAGTLRFSDNGGIITQLNVTVAMQHAIGTAGMRCGTGTVGLSAVPGIGADQVRWYATFKGGSVLHTGTSYTTPSISTTTTYYITSYNSSTSQETLRAAVTATVNVAVSNATSLMAAARCGTGSVTLSATVGTNGNTLRWYDLSSGGTVLGTGTSYSPSVSSTTTYYVSSFHSVSECESARQSIVATVNPVPETPAAENISICGSGTAGLTATPGTDGNTARWYSASVGGSPLATGTGYSPSVSSNTTYYVSSYHSGTGCESTGARKAVTVTVESVPAAPTATAAYFGRFGRGVDTLRVTGSTHYRWFTNSNVLLPDDTTATFMRYFSATTSYKVKAINTAGCLSSALTLTGNVAPIPVISFTGSTFKNPGDNLALSTQSVYDTYQWTREHENISGADEDTHTATTPGSYRVTVTLPNGRSRTSTPVRMTRYGNAPATIPAAVYDNNTPGTVTAYTRKNYVRTYTAGDAGLAPAAFELATFDSSKVSIATTYLDGLGMPVQAVQHKASPLGNDIVVHAAYDRYGRTVREYLPYSATSVPDEDGYRKNAPGEQYTFHRTGISPGIPVTGVAYSETLFEPSPLNRAVAQAAPGETWKAGSNREVKSAVRAYYPDVDGEVIRWQVSNSQQLQQAGTYAEGLLHVSQVTDENGALVREFTDREGNMILKAVQGDGNAWLNTAYVYDVRGNLRFVLPPKLMDTLAVPFVWATHYETYIKPLAFEYTYDKRGRMTEKKVPGAGIVYMVYDLLDRLVLTQDANQRNRKQWMFTKYDALKRPVITGIYTHADSVGRAAMQALVSTSLFAETYTGSGTHGYSAVVFPTTNLTLHTVTYYDTYAFRSDLAGNGYAFVNNHLEGQDTAYATRIHGQVTGTRTNILGTNGYLWAVNYYDSRQRLLQAVVQNHLDSADRITTVYDFEGKAIRTRTTHSTASSSTGITRSFAYDHADRLLGTWHRVDAEDSVLLSAMAYNEAGQLQTKKLHSETGDTFRQTIGYTYNVKGWLTNSAGEYFSLGLYYTSGFAQNQFNGNISGMKWHHALENKSSAAGFAYDNLNRLKESHYTVMNNATDNWTEAAGHYNEKLAYDFNGNIETLERTGVKDNQLMGGIDDLAYAYAGNRLLTVTDASTQHAGFKDGNTSGNDYTYDANGSMTKDKNKGITSITYNHLNLPAVVRKSGADSIVYTYDAGGRKLRQQVYGATAKVTEYAGEFIYENDTLRFINHEEGRIIPEGNEYQYHLKDHLGNVRMTFTSKEETDNAIATMETANATDEQGEFIYYNEAVKVNSLLFDHTNSGATKYAVRLTGTANERFGLAKSISVMPGDTIRASVFAKYLDTNSGNWTTALTNFMASIANSTAPAGTVVDGGLTGSTGGATPPFASLLDKDDESGTAPKAYLNFLVFDRRDTLIDAGFVRVTTDAREYGQDGAHEELFKELPITQAGYVYLYLSNDNAALGGNVIEVFFDDFMVEHVKSPVIQQDDYYAFGLNFNSYQRENTIANQYKISSKELQDELDLGWFDYGKRMYQPEIGKWTSPDPLAYEYFDHSPYTFVLNNPLKYVDPKGDSVELIIGKPYTDAAGELHPYGHVALRVYNSAEGYDKVYDFGRYGAVRGLFGQTGDGILNVYNNSEAYLKEEQSIRESNGYSKATTVEEDKKIMAHFDGLIAEGSSYSKRNNKDRKSYKLDDYDITDNNCCTVAGGGLNQINQNWMGNDEFDPRDALKTLEKDYKSLGLTKKVYYEGGVRITVYEAQKKPENKKRRMSRQEEPMID